MTALLVVTLIAAISAYRNNHDSGSFYDSRAHGNDEYANSGKSSDNAAATVAHFNDLELARYTDTSRESRTIRKDYTGFSLSFNPENGTADWVGWELLRSETDGQVARSNKFRADPSVTGSPSPNDYSNSGYDNGHLCPAADQKWSQAAMNDCFVMTNMTPQVHALNNGAWKTLEKKERLWSQRDSALVIVAGPIYADSDTKRIGDSGVRVPSAFYKVLLAPYLSNPRAIAFVYPNMTAPGNMANYVTTVDEVERLTGLDFFYNLPDDIENRVEANSSFTIWDTSR